ncbi:hypothetical protein ACQCT5_04575 [Sutcliffiella halmapala]
MTNATQYKVKTLNQSMSKLHNGLITCEDRNELIRSLIMPNGFYIDEINTMINSQQYKNTHVKKGKSLLSEQDPFCIKLDYLADYILQPENGKKHHEKSWLSRHAMEQNGGREVYINYQESDWKYGGISEEALDIARFNQEQKNYFNQRFSEDVKRKNRRISVKDMNNYPELISMQSTVLMLKDGLWVGTDAEESVRKEYIQQYDAWISEMKNVVFNNWMKGESRVDLNEYTNNPYKWDVLELEMVNEPILDNDLLEKKFAKLLYYYGLPMDGKVAYKKLRKVVNEINYEMSVVKENLRKPIRNGGYKPKVANPNFIPNEKFNEITLSNSDHVFGLFTFETDSIKVAADGGKQIRFKNYISLYQLLKDTYGSWVGNHIYHLLVAFEKSLEATGLDDMQRDIVDVVLQKEALSEKYDKHPYKRAAQYIEEKHGVKLENRDVKRKLGQISKLIASVYIDLKV